MTYEMKPLSCNPAQLKGLSEKLIVSHYENNYGGAVKRLNAITAQLEDLDFATAPGFVINGLKREELIASNSMILHELYFDGLGKDGEPDKDLQSAIVESFGNLNRGQTQFVAMGKAVRVQGDHGAGHNDEQPEGDPGHDQRQDQQNKPSGDHRWLSRSWRM